MRLAVRLRLSFALALLPALIAARANAQYAQWEFWADWDSTPKYSTELEAVAHMQDGPSWRYQYLTVRGPIVDMNRDAYKRRWTTAPVAPTVGAWSYQHYCGAGASYSSFQDALDACMTVLQSHPGNSCAWMSAYTGEGDWDVEGSFLGIDYDQTKLIFVDQWHLSNIPMPHCASDPTNPHTYSIRAVRSVTCPSGFSADAGSGKCLLDYTGFTWGRVSICVKERGNPCDAGTGSKVIREMDYSGPGISFGRTFNTQTEDSWVHSFSAYLVPSGSWALGLVTATSHHEPFRNYGSGKFVAYTGSGIEARLESGEWAVYYPSGAKDYFNSDGVLLRQQTATGQVTTINRNASGEIETVVGPFGHTLTFEYTAEGDLETIIDPDGEEISYTYDTQRRLVTATYQDASERTYHYEDSAFDRLVTGITDETGERFATYSYDSIARASESEHAGGFGGVALSYSASSTTVTDAEGNTTTYNFTTDVARMRKITSEVLAGSTRSYTYPTWNGDNQQRPTEMTDENGVVTKFAYDTHHKTSETQAFGTAQARTRSYTYLDLTTDRLTLVTSPSVKSGSLREVETTYNGAGLPVATEINGFTPSGAAVSRTTTLDYNSDGQVIEIDGPRTDVSDVTTFTYYDCATGDECGQLESVTNALGHQTTYDAYDAHGQLLEKTDANGVVTEYVYDLRGRTTSITATPPSGPPRVTTYTYDDAGQLETVESPNGTLLTYEYDDAHNLLSIADNDGNTIEYGYDLNGNRTSEDIYDASSVLKKTVDYVYDARDRLESINSAGSIAERVYDALGNLTDETDPNSNDTEHDYDPLNRLIETVDALSGVTEYGYDKNDLLTSVEAPNGATTSYVYDDLGNLLSMTSPDTGTTTYTYDAAGNRLSQTDANGVTVEYTYDALNRLAGIEYPNSALDVALTYDQGTNQKGLLTTMADGSGTTSLSYDVYGNLAGESKVIGSHTHVTAYSYDAANLVESITYPSGRTVDYARNVLGQVTEIETTYDSPTVTVVEDMTYEPFGPLSGLTFGNGLVLARDFDQQYRLTEQTTGSVQDLSFTLDASGNIDAITDSVNSSLTQTFTQDALHRIAFEEGAYGTKDYTYDAVGNRLTRVHDSGSIATQTLTYVANSNRMATHAGNTVTIDSAGNTTADPTLNVSFVYDDHNRMVEAYAGAVLQASYVYDGRGRRVKKIEATGAQRTLIYHYGLGGELLGETIYSSAGAKIGERDYLWVDSLPLAQSERTFSGSAIASSEFVYIHADQLNTPRLATSGIGTVVWRWDSDAFGIGGADSDPDADTNLVNIRLRFPGQYLDDETGLHYNYFRDYDPRSGRYVESDPIGLKGGTNTYAYVRNRPTQFIDPRGLKDCNCDNRVYNFTAGAGGLLGMVATASADSGVAIDTEGNTCIYSMLCASPPPLGGALGSSLNMGASAGTGRLCSGQTICIGAQSVGGVVFGVEGQLLKCGDGLVIGRGQAFAGESVGAGIVVCKLTLICWKDSACCKK
jgi:RHS repeat-associated protein